MQVIYPIIFRGIFDKNMQTHMNPDLINYVLHNMFLCGNQFVDLLTVTDRNV